MKKLFVIAMLLVAVLIAAMFLGHKASASANTSTQPSYTADGKLMLPAGYRDWIFLSSGFGMNYSEGANSEPLFTNVFVSPEAYRGFLKDAKWPDKSLFIVEEYSAASHGSINKAGHYQEKFTGLAVEVKDSSRPQEWSYYAFAPGQGTAKTVGAGCNNCHDKNAAVEHTFVQFYPTLLDFAVKNNLIKAGVEVVGQVGQQR